jgi:hypothetical protein
VADKINQSASKGSAQDNVAGQRIGNGRSQLDRASDYAAIIASVGIDPTEAIRIVEAALDHPSIP